MPILKYFNELLKEKCGTYTIKYDFNGGWGIEDLPNNMETEFIDGVKYSNQQDRTPYTIENIPSCLNYMLYFYPNNDKIVAWEVDMEGDDTTNEDGTVNRNEIKILRSNYTIDNTQSGTLNISYNYFDNFLGEISNDNATPVIINAVAELKSYTVSLYPGNGVFKVGRVVYIKNTSNNVYVKKVLAGQNYSLPNYTTSIGVIYYDYNIWDLGSKYDKYNYYYIIGWKDITNSNNPVEHLLYSYSNNVVSHTNYTIFNIDKDYKFQGIYLQQHQANDLIKAGSANASELTIGGEKYTKFYGTNWLIRLTINGNYVKASSTSDLKLFHVSRSWNIRKRRYDYSASAPYGYNINVNFKIRFNDYNWYLRTYGYSYIGLLSDFYQDNNIDMGFNINNTSIWGSRTNLGVNTPIKNVDGDPKQDNGFWLYEDIRNVNEMTRIGYLAFKNMHINDTEATIEFNFSLTFNENSLSNYYDKKYLIQIGNKTVSTFEFFYSYFRTLE